MYAFRKPITVVEFAGEGLANTGIDLKTAFLIGQLVGYAASKFAGIVVCSAVAQKHRGRMLVAFILLAELALVGFAVLPGGWRVAAMFVNGLPLGMVWGLVIRYLEGRRISDLLLAGLSASFILSSGVVKDIGRWLLGRGISEAWMPATTGALFIVPFLICVALLEYAPAPDAADEADRVPRRPMTSAERRAFVFRFSSVLAPLGIAYAALTAYRDFRDNYGIEIFRELGFLELPALFIRTELPASIGALAALGLLYFFRRHGWALVATYVMMAGGCASMLVISALFHAGVIDGLDWMILLGVGAYVAYIPVASVFFERLTAVGGSAGTAVFGIYIADALGYTGSIGAQLYRDLFASDVTRLAFFEDLTWGVGVLGTLLFTASGLRLYRVLNSGRDVRKAQLEDPHQEEVAS